MRHEERFELGGGDLEALVLDELLGPVHDEEIAVRVHVSHVTGVVPALTVETGRRLPGLIEIALHDLRTADQELPFPTLGHRLSRHHIDHLHLGVRDHAARGPRDRKSTRLNSSHGYISYAVFCLKKKK